MGKLVHTWYTIFGIVYKANSLPFSHPFSRSIGHAYARRKSGRRLLDIAQQSCETTFATAIRRQRMPSSRLSSALYESVPDAVHLTKSLLERRPSCFCQSSGARIDKADSKCKSMQFRLFANFIRLETMQTFKNLAIFLIWPILLSVSLPYDDSEPISVVSSTPDWGGVPERYEKF